MCFVKKIEKSRKNKNFNLIGDVYDDVTKKCSKKLKTKRSRYTFLVQHFHQFNN